MCQKLQEGCGCSREDSLPNAPCVRTLCIHSVHGCGCLHEDTLPHRHHYHHHPISNRERNVRTAGLLLQRSLLTYTRSLCRKTLRFIFCLINRASQQTFSFDAELWDIWGRGLYVCTFGMKLKNARSLSAKHLLKRFTKT